MTVLHLPPRDSCRILVSLESLRNQGCAVIIDMSDIKDQ
jgi:hypothetical protein